VLLDHKADQLSGRSDAQLFHDMTAMQFHRPIADIEGPGDRLTGQTFRHLLQHIALTLGQCSQTFGEAPSATDNLPSLGIAPQRLTHAVNCAAAITDHRDIRIVDGETLGATRGNQLFTRRRDQHAIIAKCDDVAPQPHHVPIWHVNNADALRLQPGNELRLDHLHADGREVFSDHSHLHIKMQEMRVEAIGVKFPALALELVDRRQDLFAVDLEALAALQRAARTAAEVPLACVEACRAVVVAAESLAGRSNLNASSDLAVACLLAGAAAQGAGANVLVNLPAVGDDAFAQEMRIRVTSLLEQIESISAATRSIVGSGQLRPVPAGAG